MGDYERALKYVEIELAMNDQNMFFCFNYGYFNHLVGNEEEAEKGLEKALKLIVTERDKDYMLYSLSNIKDTDSKKSEYPKRFIDMIADKFQ